MDHLFVSFKNKDPTNDECANIKFNIMKYATDVGFKNYNAKIWQVYSTNDICGLHASFM